MYEFNNILLTLLTVGGIGFINYAVTDQLGTTQLYSDSNQMRLGYCLVWSIIDYVIYLMLLQWLKQVVAHNWLFIVATLLTLAIAWLGTSLLAFPIYWVTYKFYDWITAKASKVDVNLTKNESDPWEMILDETRSENTQIYLFTLDHKPISAGTLYTYSADERSNYQTVTYPLKEPLESYDELHERLLSDKVQNKRLTYEYVNTKQGFIAFITQPRTNN